MAAAPTKTGTHDSKLLVVTQLDSNPVTAAYAGVHVLGVVLIARWACHHGHDFTIFHDAHPIAKTAEFVNDASAARSSYKTAVNCRHPKRGGRAIGWCRLAILFYSLSQPEDKYERVLFLGADNVPILRSVTLDALFHAYGKTAFHSIPSASAIMFGHTTRTPNPDWMLWRNTAASRKLLAAFWDSNYPQWNTNFNMEMSGLSATLTEPKIVRERKAGKGVWSRLTVIPHSLVAASAYKPGQWDEKGDWQYGCWKQLWGHFSSGFEATLGVQGRRPLFLRLLGLSSDAQIDLDSEELWGTPAASSTRGTCKPLVLKYDANLTILNLYDAASTWANLSVMGQVLRESNSKLLYSFDAAV